MSTTTAIPGQLYKYKAFNSDSLELIIADKLFFSHPSKFNDPLDCQTQVVDDINDENVLRDILFKLHQKNARNKFLSAAKKLRYKGLKTLEKIELLSSDEGNSAITEIYNRANFEGEDIDITKELTSAIGEIILSGYNNGVLSLAEKNDCPLMWAHYADNHQGICLGYSIPFDQQHLVSKINYEGTSRTISTSQIIRMLNGDPNAKKEIEDAIFLRKASQWGYENEWRAISNVGLQKSFFILTDITFGIRCKETTAFTIMKTMSVRDQKIKFFQMKEVSNKFDLTRTEVFCDNEKFSSYPICNQYNREMTFYGEDD